MIESLQLWFVLIVAAIGTIFMLISAIGILRLPDVFTRMHAAGKAATLGVSCLLLSTGIFFWAEDQFWRMVALIVLFFVTAPVATTSMARAAYQSYRHEDLHLHLDEMRADREETAAVPEPK